MFNRSSKVVGLISVLVAGAVFMSACSVDMDGIGKAFQNLGQNLNNSTSDSESTEASQTTEVIIVETSETEQTLETEVEVTPIPTATSTPIPTATPMPQRVDFSELTRDSLIGTITVDTEEFEESSHAEDDDSVVLATFSGVRLLLESEDELPVVTAVNMMLNGFYMEAQGLYNRAVNETSAAYALQETTVSLVAVKIDYKCFFNGRLLGVIMNYEVEVDEEITSDATEYVMYDLYTGQYITPELLFTDVSALYLDICGDIAHDTEDTRDKASDYQVIYLASNDEEDDDIPAVVIVMHAGQLEEYEVDLTDYEQFISRNGRVLLGFDRFAEEVAQEEEDEVQDEVLDEDIVEEDN